MARVVDGIVRNIEVVESVWLASEEVPEGVVFVADSGELPAQIGLRWDAESGFEQPMHEGLTNE